MSTFKHKQLDPEKKKAYIDAIHHTLLTYLLANNILEQFILGMQTKEDYYIKYKHKAYDISSSFSWVLGDESIELAGLPWVNWRQHYENFASYDS